MTVDPEAVAADVLAEADRLVAEGLAAMECGDECPQDELFARWQAKYG